MKFAIFNLISWILVKFRIADEINVTNLNGDSFKCIRAKGKYL